MNFDIINDAKKIAVDIHGVIDSNVVMWETILRTMIRRNKEVHILSGPDVIECYKELVNYGIRKDTHYNYLFSIVTSLWYGAYNMWKDENGWWALDEDWDKQKGLYCEKHNIDVCIDDTKRYKKYMPKTTKFMLWRK
jgi:hypothetical protein